MKNIVLQPDNRSIEAMEEAFLKCMTTGTGMYQNWMGLDFAEPGSDTTVIYKTSACGLSTFMQCDLFNYLRAPWDTRKNSNSNWLDRKRYEYLSGQVLLPDLKLSVLAVRWAWRIE